MFRGSKAGNTQLDISNSSLQDRNPADNRNIQFWIECGILMWNFNASNRILMLWHLLDYARKLCYEDSPKRVVSFQLSIQSRPKRPVTLHGPFKLGLSRIIFMLEDGAFLSFFILPGLKRTVTASVLKVKHKNISDYRRVCSHALSKASLITPILRLSWNAHRNSYCTN